VDSEFDRGSFLRARPVVLSPFDPQLRLAPLCAGLICGCGFAKIMLRVRGENLSCSGATASLNRSGQRARQAACGVTSTVKITAEVLIIFDPTWLV